jgi:serine/threonine-protein kinase
MIGEKGETLVYVPAGEFTMGDGANDAPIHTVYLDAFWIDQTEVTNKQYKVCVDAGTCEPPDSMNSFAHPSYFGNPEFDNYPVLYVNWDKANRYCEVWKGGDGDLPTEAQWEKAARGTDARTYPWGSQWDVLSIKRLNFSDKNDPTGASITLVDDGYADTAPVGSYLDGISPYGAYDMAGNVWEWVNDWYGETYYKDTSSSNNPVGPETGQYRGMRGGSWDYYGNFILSAYRGRNLSSYSSNRDGFRCIQSP